MLAFDPRRPSLSLSPSAEGVRPPGRRRRLPRCANLRDVRYRLGRRAYPVVRAGTFKSEREARVRRDLVAGEIARGGNPADLLEQFQTAPTFASFEAWADRYVTARIDLAENTRKMHRSHLRKLGETFNDRDPAFITAPEVAEWFALQATERKPGTLAQYLEALKAMFDHIGIDPNPARDPRVRLPRRVSEEATRSPTTTT